MKEKSKVYLNTFRFLIYVATFALAAQAEESVSIRKASANPNGSHAAEAVVAKRPVAEPVQTADLETLKLAKYHLTMYNQLLLEERQELRAKSDHLLQRANHGVGLSAGYVFRGALDGLGFGMLLKGAMGAKAATGAIAAANASSTSARSAAVEAWLAAGGWEALKGLAKGTGLIGASGVAAKATLPKYELQFAVPIWGSAVLANRFSNEIFTAHDAIDTLGVLIANSMSESAKVQKAIDAINAQIKQKEAKKS